MADKRRFVYSAGDPTRYEDSLLPQLTLRLSAGKRTINLSALLDTGATVNVLPYQAGIALGLRWDDENIPVRLSGNLGRYDARAIALTGLIADFQPVELAFAWTKLETVPVILGQYNFFMSFNVCFLRHEFAFEIEPIS